jgi:hypothetical protein
MKREAQTVCVASVWVRHQLAIRPSPSAQIRSISDFQDRKVFSKKESTPIFCREPRLRRGSLQKIGMLFPRNRLKPRSAP